MQAKEKWQGEGLAAPHAVHAASPHPRGTRCQGPACPFFGKAEHYGEMGWDGAGMGVHIGGQAPSKKLRGTQMWGRQERFDIHSHGYDIMSYLEMEELLSVHAFRSVADALFLCLSCVYPHPYRLQLSLP